MVAASFLLSQRPVCSDICLGLGEDCCRKTVSFWPLVALAGMLLAVHLLAHPEMATHLQVEATVSAGIARRVAIAVLLDPHSLSPTREAGRGHNQ